MNEQVKIFESPQFGQIRTAGTSDNPLFCLRDVCRVLGLRSTDVKNRLNTPRVVSIVVGVQTGVKTDGTPAIQQKEMLFIGEANLYKVIMRSDKPQAEAFQDWVCGEVLPSIRKSGGYLATAPEETPEMIMAKALKLADSKIKEQAARLEEAETTIALKDDAIACYSEQLKKQAPFAEYAQDVLQSRHGYTLTVVAKDLGFTSIHKFTDWAKERRILYRQGAEWVPTANWSGRGYFTTYTYRFFRKDGAVETRLQLLVTERGRAALHYTLRNNCRPSAAILEGGEL